MNQGYEIMGNQPNDPNTWEKWAHHVLQELNDAKDARVQMNQAINDLKVQIAILTTKAGIIGASVGIVTSILVTLLSRLFLK